MPLQRVLDRGISIAKSPRTTLALPVDAPHRRKRHLLRAEDPVRTPRTPMTGYPGDRHHAETISRIAAKHATRTPRPRRGPGLWLAGPEIETSHRRHRRRMFRARQKSR